MQYTKTYSVINYKGKYYIHVALQEISVLIPYLLGVKYAYNAYVYNCVCSEALWSYASIVDKTWSKMV